MGSPLPPSTDALTSALPGWRVLGELEPAGWSPERHFRGALLNPRGDRVRVFVRRAWDWPSLQAELYAYRHLLPKLPVRTPHLWAAFTRPEDDSQWMVLEDLGTRMIRAYEAADRASLLAALGLLHGKGNGLIRRLPADHPLPRFTAGNLRYDSWRALLAETSEVGLGEPASALLDRVLERLARQPVTLLHGDMDFGNVLLVDGGVALIDWERVCLGPAPLDLGPLVSNLTGPEELDAYRGAYALATGRDLSAKDLQELLDLADAHDALRFLCVYLGGKQEGRDYGPEWRQEYFVPRVDRVRALLERGA